MKTTSTRKPTEREFVRALEAAGFRFYETGTMRNRDNSRAGTYYKGDRLTDDQKAQLADKFGTWIQFFTARAQYAPEQIKPVILLKSTKEHARTTAHA